MNMLTLNQLSYPALMLVIYLFCQYLCSGVKFLNSQLYKYFTILTLFINVKKLTAETCHERNLKICKSFCSRQVFLFSVNLVFRSPTHHLKISILGAFPKPVANKILQPHPDRYLALERKQEYFYWEQGLTYMCTWQNSPSHKKKLFLHQIISG